MRKTKTLRNTEREILRELETQDNRDRQNTERERQRERNRD